MSGGKIAALNCPHNKNYYHGFGDISQHAMFGRVHLRENAVGEYQSNHTCSSLIIVMYVENMCVLQRTQLRRAPIRAGGHITCWVVALQTNPS